ncbi:MAG: DUF2027 domain-containing protein [Prevotella sp.]
MKIGDKVRFLSETGGGVIAGFQGKDVVLVEDEDGFQIPTSIKDVVVDGGDDYDITPDYGKQNTDAEKKEIEPADMPITFKAAPEERRGGDVLSVYLAFVPMDIKELTRTRFEAYMVNDSNFYVRYAYFSAEGNAWHLRHTAEVEPNTKLFIEEFDREQLSELERVSVQIIAYKRDKPFLLKPAIDVTMRIDTVKFYKLHTFRENDFFEQDALIYPIVEQDRPVRTLVVDAERLKSELVGKIKTDTVKTSTVVESGKKDKNSPLVIDLHASSLLDTTSGMTSADILKYQIDTFRKTMEQHKGHKGTKIIFIHGKGEGVLRHTIIHELNYRYKNCTYQDASFREYGYGATQVTIK